jgi:hypothetical protein
MREDPSFFADVVGDWSEHSSTQVLAPSRKMHPDLTSALRKQGSWDRTIVSAVNESHENLIVWDIVSKLIDEIMSYQRCQDGGKQNRPEDVPGYVDTVRELKVLLKKRVIEKMQRDFGFILPASPPMRSMFESGQGELSLRSELPKNGYFLWLAGP